MRGSVGVRELPRDLRLRQNYIINRDHAYTTLQDQFSELAVKP